MFKLLIVGDQAAGKTSIVRQFVDKTFDPLYKNTVAADFTLKVIEIDGKPIHL